MPHTKLALLFLASLGLAACQGSNSSSSSESGGGGAGGTAQGGDGGSTNTSTTTTSTSTAPACETPVNPEKYAMGTGEKCFAPLADGDEVPLMNGPQGGYHVWLALGCADCGTTVHMKYGVHDPATNMPLPETYDEESMVSLVGSDWPQAAGIILHMPGLGWDPNDPALPKGTKVLLWADAYTPQGDLWHHGEVTVTIGDIVEWDPCATDPNNPICQTG